MKKTIILICLVAIFCSLSVKAIHVQTPRIDGEAYILQTYKTCNIIGISEGLHGLENSHSFFKKLFENTEFQKTVNVIIVEFGSIGYQDILDKYIAGEKVDINGLQKVWRESGGNTTGNWDRRMYFELLQQIRNINNNLPWDKRIRVLAADPAIDWKSVNTIQDYFKYLPQRDLSPAHLAIEYGITRNQKVLIIYGGTHFSKLSDEKLDSSYWSITTVVNKRKPGSMKVIEILNPDNFSIDKQTKKWALNSIIDLHTNRLGDSSSEKLFPETVNQKGEKVIPFAGYKIRDLYDAFLYVGASKSWKIADIPKSVFADDDYWKELNRRSKIVWGQPLDEQLRK